MEEESGYINRLQKTKDIIKLSSIALILIVWSIVSFIAYQNNKLQEKVKENNTISKTSTPINFVTDSENKPINIIENTISNGEFKGWVEYIDYDNGYSIIYPPTIYTRQHCIGEGFLLQDINSSPRTSIEEHKCNRDWAYHLEISINDKPTDVPITDEYYKVTKDSVSINGTPTNIYTLNLIYHPRSDEMPWMEWFKEVFIENNNKYYKIFFQDKKNEQLFDQILSTFKFLSDTSHWKTYTNKKYGFEVYYYPQSDPIENTGTNEVGQFTYLFLVKFGTVSLKSQYGYSLEVNNGKSIDDYRTDLVGHITDKIDSEEEIMINNNSWTKINFKIFLTTDYIPVTLAFINNSGYGYAITSSSLDINQILSTFKFLPSISNINLKYPSTYKKLEAPKDGTSYLTNNILALQGPTLSKTKYEHTPYITISSEDIQSSECYTQWWDNKEIENEISINNTAFRTVNRYSAALGTHYRSKIYRTMKNNLCYEIMTTIRIGGDWNTVNENDYLLEQDNTQKELDQILSTFEFVD